MGQNETLSAQVFKRELKAHRAFETISAFRLAVSSQQCLRYEGSIGGTDSVQYAKCRYPAPIASELLTNHSVNEMALLVMLVTEPEEYPTGKAGRLEVFEFVYQPSKTLQNNKPV